MGDYSGIGDAMVAGWKLAGCLLITCFILAALLAGLTTYVLLT